MDTTKQELIAKIESRVEDKALERSNADLLIKLINNADSIDEAISIAELGTMYKRTGLHFDPRLEKMSNTIKYFEKNDALSFTNPGAKRTHKLIIGDNYDALQNLLIQYKGKIDVIYIDPPYGKDSMGEFADTNYDNAITRDNLLSMLYPRLVLARQLMSEEGVIFCSVDDKNQAYIKCLFDEVFGERNFIATFIWEKHKAPKNDNKYVTLNHEYILCYAKLLPLVQLNKYERSDENIKSFKNPDNDPRGVWTSGPLLAPTYTPSTVFEIVAPNGKVHYPPSGKCWSFNKEGIQRLMNENRIWFGADGNNVPRIKRFLSELNAGVGITSMLLHDDVGGTQVASNFLKTIFGGQKLFLFPKPLGLINKLIYIASKQDSIILDFFAGSGTTAHGVLQANQKDGGNRTYILCQMNEVTETNPNGIAYDVTSKRLKRIMTGECYDGSKDFEWIKKNKPYGDNLDVYEIKMVADNAQEVGQTPFDLIDETLYGKEKFATKREKIEWVCQNFQRTEKYLEE